ncbi:MAG: hypothetical protein AAFX93_19445 [Verrucomicrobiota bacterium]
MFKEAGRFRVKITEAFPAEAKFNKDDSTAFDIAIAVQRVDDPSQSGYWSGEISKRYGRGNLSHMTQAQITMETLRKIGYEGVTLELANLQALIGKETEAMIESREYEGKTYYDVKYLGESSGGVKAMDAGEAARRLQALTGMASTQSAAPAPSTQQNFAPPPAQTGGVSNPFA